MAIFHKVRSASPKLRRARKSLGLKQSVQSIVRPTRHKGARLGQHFLMHPRIADRIAMVALLTPDTTVLEIGPGTGMLTRALLQRAGRVVAIEADYELFKKLQTDFADEIKNNKLELIHGDIRDYPLHSAIAVNSGYYVVSNIPYYLTGEIFKIFLSAEHQPRSMTLLVQKEVAERIVRARKESILSLSVKAYGTPKYEFTVPRGAFIPAPKVDSAVLTIRDISRKNFTTRKQEKRFFELIHAGFAHKRKFVCKNLAEANLPFSDIPEKSRAEDLSLEQWLVISRE